MMWNPVGLVINVVNIILFGFMLIYVAVYKKSKDISHYLFLLVVQSFLFYSIFDMATYFANREWAIMLFNITPIFLGMSIYFYAVFTLYLKSGFSRDSMVLLLFPMIFVVGVSFGDLAVDVIPRAWGWIPEYNLLYLALYALLFYAYIGFGSYNLYIVYRNVEGEFKKRAFRFFLGSITIIILGTLYVLSVYTGHYTFPLMDLSVMIYGLFHAYSLLK